MGNRTTLLLVVLGALLAGGIAAFPHLPLIDSGPIPVHEAPPLEAPAARDGATAEDSVELADLTETVDRPLFSETRRPPVLTADAPIEAAPVAAVSVTPPPLELSAVIIDGARRLALFRSTAGVGESRRAEEGSEIDGWTVSAVRPDGVVLERGDARHEVALRTFRPPPAPPRNNAAPRRRAADQDAAENPAVERRPRRPLRGPRRRSVRRQDQD